MWIQIHNINNKTLPSTFKHTSNLAGTSSSFSFDVIFSCLRMRTEVFFGADDLRFVFCCVSHQPKTRQKYPHKKLRPNKTATNRRSCAFSAASRISFKFTTQIHELQDDNFGTIAGTVKDGARLLEHSWSGTTNSIDVDLFQCGF